MILKEAGAKVVDRLFSSGDELRLDCILTDGIPNFIIEERAKKLKLPLVLTQWVIQCLVDGTRIPFDTSSDYVLG